MDSPKTIVAKFGGSSMADAQAIRQVIEIISSDPNRRIIVVSAPGKNLNYQEKVTDQLLKGNWKEVENRFLKEGQNLGWKKRKSYLSEAHREFSLNFESPDYRASRGEWLAARMLADLLGARFIDSAELIRINPDGSVHEASYRLINLAIGDYPGKVVFPGFYGLDVHGRIKTFPRGGSDITGAIIARAVGAKVYENWTDVDGVMTHDPKFHREARTLEKILVDHMVKMAREGAKVLHPDCLAPVMNSGIPVLVRNTFNLDSSGTLVITDQQGQG